MKAASGQALVETMLVILTCVILLSIAGHTVWRWYARAHASRLAFELTQARAMHNRGPEIPSSCTWTVNDSRTAFSTTVTCDRVAEKAELPVLEHAKW